MLSKCCMHVIITLHVKKSRVTISCVFFTFMTFTRTFTRSNSCILLNSSTSHQCYQCYQHQQLETYETRHQFSCIALNITVLEKHRLWLNSSSLDTIKTNESLFSSSIFNWRDLSKQCLKTYMSGRFTCSFLGSPLLSDSGVGTSSWSDLFGSAA